MTDRALFSCRLVRALLLPALAACGLQARQEKPQNLQQLSLEELLNVKVTVASRTETTVLEAPSVVSVYTAEDLRRMGARDLRDVLRQVPGFEVGVRAQLGYPEIGVRGILTDNSEKPAGEWNEMVIECRGRAIDVWVNGDHVNHGEGCTAEQGQIAIQAEGAPVEFRKFELAPLGAMMALGYAGK